MEKVMIEHPLHEHPLILRESVDNEGGDCYGCGEPIGEREWVYVCVQESPCKSIIFHRRCGELAIQISHPSHAQHPLYLFDFHPREGRHQCNVCLRRLGGELGYRCLDCDFDLDVTCKKLGKNELFGEARQLQHPCHTIHPLMLIRTPPFVFKCNGCGTEDHDMAYACTTCGLLIHKACTLLPSLLSSTHHHHQLSLSSRFPLHHPDFYYRCSVCDKAFSLFYWVYYCDDCRFFAHIKCATSEKDSNLEQDKKDDGSILIEFPLEDCDISEELIKPFVIRENGLDEIPEVNDMIPSTTMPTTKEFNYHMHTLSFISDLSYQDVEDDGDDDDSEEMKMKICNVCVTPISSPPYYECASCNYVVHSVCYLLPKTLSPLESQLYGYCERADKNHNFALYSSSKMLESGFLRCDICSFNTSGMVYLCEECGVRIDVKCACLPTTIKHALHPNHILIKMIVSELMKCRCCGYYIYPRIQYICTCKECYFALCLECVVLPKSVINWEWDKHLLQLTNDASTDHPTNFYCAFCEKQMDANEWMYHCSPCDNSFHPKCLKTGSGCYKNIKLGGRFDLKGIHPHTLTFNYITLRKKCCICLRNVYTELGLMCSSCYYVVCSSCGEKELAEKNM